MFAGPKRPKLLPQIGSASLKKNFKTNRGVSIVHAWYTMFFAHIWRRLVSARTIETPQKKLAGKIWQPCYIYKRHLLLASVTTFTGKCSFLNHHHCNECTLPSFSSPGCRGFRSHRTLKCVLESINFMRCETMETRTTFCSLPGFRNNNNTVSLHEAQIHIVRFRMERKHLD